jgi:hypothetical protein
MPAYKFQINPDSPIKLGGIKNPKRPGETFILDCFEDGKPTDIYWRKRMADQDRCGTTHIVRLGPVKATAAPVAAPTPPAPSSSTPEAPAEDETPAPAPAPARSKKG